MKRLLFERQLTPVDFERVIFGASPTRKSDRGWTQATIKEGLFIDLSEVEFAEFTTLAQVALLVESAARHGISVKVALPFARHRVGEQKFILSCRKSDDPAKLFWAHSTEKAIRLRQNALQFMEHSGFIEALEVAHVPDAKNLIKIVDDYDSGREVSYDDPNSAEPLANSQWYVKSDKTNYFLKRIFRLRWFPPLNGDKLLKSQNYAAAILGFKDIGLTDSDAMALAGTLLHELIENVYFYGSENLKNDNGQPYALVGAVVFDPDTYQLRPENFRPSLREFVEWAADTNSPVIRVVVGDSGAGIPHTLGPHFSSDNEDEIPNLEPPLRPTEKTLFWAFNPWSTSDKEAALIKRGTRGLWRVQCLVQSYDGAVTIRSEDAMVGWTYQSLNNAKEARDSNLRFIPGTFIDICLLSKIHPRKKLSPNPVDAPRQVPNFEIVRCKGSETESLSEEDLKRLVKELRKATPDKPKCIIATLDVIPLWAPLTQEVLIDLLQTATNLTNHGALSLLCPDVTWRQIEPTVKSLDTLMDELSQSRLAALGVPKSPDPVILIDSSGEARWFGGNVILRKLLTALLAAPDSYLDEQSIKELVSNEEELNALYRSLKNQPHLIEFTGDGIRLRFITSDLNKYLIDELGRRLHNAVTQGTSKGIHKGLFRTPSLQCVTRWNNVHHLVDEVIGAGPAAYALARRIESKVLENVSEKISLVKVGMTNELVSMLNECLGLEKLKYSIPGELGAYDHPEVTRVPPGTKVILCTDLVLTENTVGHALTDLLRWNAEPLAVICILDARKNKSAKINCLGREFPLISLTEIDIIIDEPEKTDDIINVDPVLREPLKGKSFRSPDYDISPDEFLNLCRVVDGTLYFGHIERSVWRHFTTYLNAPRLIRREVNSRAPIINPFVEHIFNWVNDQVTRKKEQGQDASKFIEIWYPGSSDDFAGQIADAVKDEITQSNSDIKVVRLRGIPRVASAGRWAFPAEVRRLDKNAHIVILDWGSITSVTVQQMIRLAAEAGAASVKVIVLLSQMLIEDEMALRGIKAVNALKYSEPGKVAASISQAKLPFNINHTEAAQDNEKIEENSIPVEVVFLSFFSQGYYQPRDCPICNIRKEYASEAEHCPTELLRRHARETYELLKEKEREEVFIEEPGDLYKVPVITEEIANVVETRQQLQLALRSTEERKNVQIKLKALVDRGDPATKIAWLRLLATEPSWLKLPPLRFYDLRDDIAQIALHIAREDSGETFQIGVRRQALIVLRAASKKRFIDELPNLLERCIDETSLVQQLLHDTFTYLKRPYHHNSPDAIKRVWQSLTQCHDYLQGIAGHVEFGLEYLYTVSSLLRAAEFLRFVSSLENPSPLEAWHSLREHFLNPMEQHCEAIGCMMDVLMNMRSPALPEAIPDKVKWRTVLEEWQTCQMFLSANVFPYLKPLKELLLGSYYELLTPVDERWRLDKLIEAGIPYEMDRVADLLFDFAQSPYSFLDAIKRDVGKKEVEWWYNYFLNAGAEPKRAASKEATLLKFLRRCPCELNEVVQFAIEDMRNQGFAFHEEVINSRELETKVFCDKELLRNTIKHLIENAAGEKHSDRAKDAIPRIRFIPVQVGESQICLMVLNDGTKPTQRGKGLDALDRSLRTFDGHIEGAPFNEEAWTYKAELTLLRW
jgi:hypothetical protein